MRPLVVVLLVAGAAGCAHFNDRGVQTAVVRHKAAFDFDCDEGALEIAHMGGDIYGATGCGKKATYDASGACSKEDNCSAERQGDIGTKPSKKRAAAKDEENE